MKLTLIAAISALVCTLGVQDVSAAGTTVNVNNVNDPINHPYQESSSSACGSSDYCTLTFGTIAAPETVVQHASCYFYGDTNTPLYYAELYDAAGNSANFLPVSTLSSSIYNDYVINDNTELFFTKGGKPSLQVYSGGSISNLICTLSGYYR